MTRKYMGETWKIRIMLTGWFGQIHFRCWLLVFGDKNVLFFLVERGSLSQGKLYELFLSRKGEVRGPFLQLLLLKYRQLKVINMPEWHVLGRHVLNPFIAFVWSQFYRRWRGSERNQIVGNMAELLYQVSAEVCSIAGLNFVGQYILIII